MSSGSRGEYVRLTGQPRLVSGSTEVAFVPDKRYQLLSYLAYQGDWVGRDRLAFLFWPDTDSAGARQNLRALLKRLRSLPFDPELESTPHQLRWVVRSDVAEFRDAFAKGDPANAASALSGSLLAGLEGDDPGEFEEWLEIERERLHADWRAAVLRTVRDCDLEERGLSRSLVDALLAVDALDEEAVRTYVEASAGSHAAGDARAVYRTFVSRLEKEMGLEPTVETVAAFEELIAAEPRAGTRRGTREAPIDAAAPSETSRVDGPPLVASTATSVSPVSVATTVTAAPTASTATSRLPKSPTNFVGRLRELGEIDSLLLDDGCRLVTLLGPGGIGKTRVALAVAHVVRERFADGAVFVALDGVSSAADVPQAIAVALGVGSGDGDVLAHVTSLLADTETLLVLDNFEHVLDAADVVTRLLDACPSTKVLVTSRSLLGLQAEWVYSLEGLAYPQAPAELSEIIEFDAVTLFVARARRVKQSFQITEADIPALIRLCSLLEGAPLAIELAASWARALPLEAIEREVSRNLDALASTAPDGVARHASIRAMFEQSWNVLTEAEQGVLMRLAVFRSSASPSAARFVANASNVLLAALVDKSLVRLRANGRFALHPLLRAYSLEKLQAFPAAFESAERRHAAFYLRFLRERSDAAKGPRAEEVFAEIDVEIQEIIAAARSAQERDKESQFVAFMFLLTEDTAYLQGRGYGSGRLELLLAAADVAVANGWLHAAHELKGHAGYAYYGLGSPRKALPLFREAVELARRNGDAAEETLLIGNIGTMLAIIDGSGDEELDVALVRARELGDGLILATVLHQRGYVEGEVKGALEKAVALNREILDMADRVERQQGAPPAWIMGWRFFAHNNIGATEGQRGRLEESMRERREALAIAEASGHPMWMGMASEGMGAMFDALGNEELARQYLGQAIDIYKKYTAVGALKNLISWASTKGYDLSSLASTD